LLIIVTIAFTSCSSGGRMGSSKKGCGCGLNKGFVGY
jgi:hypothetical protein